MAPPLTRPAPRRRRIVRWIILVALALLLFCGLLLFSTPKWYRPADPAAAATIDMSESAQYRMADLHNACERAKLGPTTWSISQDQINTLLALDPSVRTALQSRGASGAMVRLLPGEIELCARVRGVPALDRRGGVVTLRFGVTCGGSPPSAVVRLEAVYANALRVPRSLAMDRLNGAARQIAAALTEALAELANRSATGAAQQQDALALVQQMLRGGSFLTQFPYRRRLLQANAITLSTGSLTITFGPAPPAPSPTGAR